MAQNRKQKETGKPLFSESVAFPEKIIILAVAIETFLYLLIIASRFIDGLKQIHMPISFVGVSLIYLIFLVFTLLLFIFKVENSVETGGIRYKLHPVERKGHFIARKEIEKYFIKNNRSKKGKKRNMSNLYLQLQSGKKIILQTRRPKEMIQAVHTMHETAEEKKS